MVILEDTRQQAKKHRLKHEYFEKIGVEIVRTKLAVGDYTLPTNQSICIDTKAGLQEVCGNVTQGHRRFIEEIDLAQKLGIKLIVLIEEDKIGSLQDVSDWKNPRRAISEKALNGEKLYKILRGIEKRHPACEFQFCKKGDAGRVIVELLGVR